jgi:hypothetical protein
VPTLVLAALVGGVGCTSRLFGDNVLSYAQVQSIQAGQSASEIAALFGEPKDSRGEGANVSQLTYAAEDPDGNVRQLRVAFDENGQVSSWTLDAN